ncbi:MAG TPA: metallophosphoesterase [Steroidobacteraceae bacterium]|nr:metallophosphoesterase [Steroidobacteraceae bacterium]
MSKSHATPAKPIPHVKSVETRYLEQREALLRGLKNLDRRSFVKVATGALGAAVAAGARYPFHSFLPVNVAHADEARQGWTFAYISDSHLYVKDTNERFVRQLLRAVDDVNNLDPQPDFVFYGGDLAQLGRKDQLDLGAQILKAVKAPVRMMVGEHDWFYDMGDHWKELFGPEHYSFDHKGVHCVVLMSVNERDFWTQRGMTPAERMQTVAGLDDGIQSRFEVGAAQREWLRKDLEKLPSSTPLLVFSHSPLYKLYRPWNFWTDDAEDVQGILQRFDKVTVLHGHTHQVLTNRIGNIDFHGMLSTAWPWPYAPEGLPALTVQMSRPNPFDPNDGLGDGTVSVHPDGLVDMLYSLWNRNPMEVKATYLSSGGKRDVPRPPLLASY